MAKARAAESLKEDISPLHPRQSEHIIAHAAAEKQLLSLINARRLPHAFLFTGPRGIGKATLAYRFARFLLAPEETGGGLFGDALPPESLHLPAQHPTFRRTALGAHPDLFVLESDTIKVEEARKVSEFLSLTPAEGKWRVVIIDSADALNRNAANALLKTLEEPPPQAELILVSHNPGMLLPTIRSRCHALRLQPLSQADFARIMETLSPGLGAQELRGWALLSACSPGTALLLMEHKADALYEELIRCIAAPDTLKQHAFAERFARKESDAQWQVLSRLMLWLFTRIATQAAAGGQEVFPGEAAALEQLARAKPPGGWTELWEKAGKLLFDTERLHLDRKQTILTLLRASAE